MSEKCTYCGGNHWRPDCEEIAKERAVAMREREFRPHKEGTETRHDKTQKN